MLNPIFIIFSQSVHMKNHPISPHLPTVGDIFIYLGVEISDGLLQPCIATPPFCGSPIR